MKHRREEEQTTYEKGSYEYYLAKLLNNEGTKRQRYYWYRQALKKLHERQSVSVMDRGDTAN